MSYSNLVPGGWFELIDSVFPIGSDDGTINDNQAIMRWVNLLIQASENLGRPLTDSMYHRSHLEEAGFTNIEERLFKWPTNSWPKDKKHKEVGLWTLANIDRGLEGLSMALLTRGCGMTHAQVTALVTEVRKDLRNPRIHAYWPM